MALIWVIDSCSLIEIKIIPHAIRPKVVAHLDDKVKAGTLVYPRQVIDELKSYANPKTLATDVPYQWVKKHEATGCHSDLLLAEGKAILKVHEDLIVKEASSKKEPADPYVIALAQKLRGEGHDARIITNDTRQIHRKVSVAAVAGLIGIPSTVMHIFLRGEGHPYSLGG